jgi:alpha-N-arabinofuranosidase
VASSLELNSTLQNFLHRSAAIARLFGCAGALAVCSSAFSIASAAEPDKPLDVTLTLHADQPGPVVNRNIYGQFAEHLGRCIYEGIWVGEHSPIPNTRGIRNDVVAALKELNIPVLRWPGGCFADTYHWKDGIGPRDKRPTMINIHWGGVTENNQFGTHEFMDLCEMLGCDPYIAGNVGSGTVQEMMEWIEYLTSDSNSTMANLRRQNGRDKPWKVPYFGVGNESWGCGGNMRPEYYADVYRHYNSFVRDLSGNKLTHIASGPNGDDYKWMDVLMAQAGKQMNGISLHYYTIPTGVWSKKGSATEFDEAGWFNTLHRTLKMEELITKHSAIMDKYDPKKKIGLVVDEWGAWYDVEPGTNPGFLYQQNTLRDAVLAGLNFHIFHRHADRVSMAAVAQTVNVLQAMILTDKEKMVRTPTYWVFEMFKGHQGGTFLPVDLQSPDYSLGNDKMPAVSASGTKDASGGGIHFSLVNTHPHQAATVSCKLAGVTQKNVTGRLLTAPEMNSRNTFDQPDAVKPVEFKDAKLDGDNLQVTLPPKSVVMLELR